MVVVWIAGGLFLGLACRSSVSWPRGVLFAALGIHSTPMLEDLALAIAASNGFPSGGSRSRSP